jgi:hypothetical protein
MRARHQIRYNHKKAYKVGIRDSIQDMDNLGFRVFNHQYFKRIKISIFEVGIVKDVPDYLEYLTPCWDFETKPLKQ